MFIHKIFVSKALLVKTRPSSDSEALTMYKLKGLSSNMQTDQSIKNKELVCLADPSS